MSETKKNEDLFFADNKKEVIVESRGQKLTFYANAISYFENQNIGVQAGMRGKNGLAMLVAASITDKDGNKFTYDEVLKLREEFAKPFFEAAVEVNAKGHEEKK